MLLENASKDIARYNQNCLHYNLVANAIYQELRRSRAPFSLAFESFLVAGLISFDMGRMIGKGGVERYDVKGEGFAARLRRKLREIEPILAPMVHLDIFGVPYKKTTQPGYSGKYYVQSLTAAMNLMVEYGADRFRSLEPGTPVMRIFDKIAFARSLE